MTSAYVPADFYVSLATTQDEVRDDDVAIMS